MTPFFSFTRVFCAALTASLLIACGSSENGGAPNSTATPAPTSASPAGARGKAL